MKKIALSEKDKIYLKAHYQKASQDALKHDVTYLAKMKPSVLHKLSTSCDDTTRSLGQHAILLQRFLVDWLNQKYQAPWEMVAKFTAVLLYIVNPFDLVPDTTAQTGYFDDLFMLQLALLDGEETLMDYASHMNIDTAEFDTIWKS